MERAPLPYTRLSHLDISYHVSAVTILICVMLYNLSLTREIEEGRKAREKGNSLALVAPKSQTCSIS
jgi:hypothetical protein